MDSQSQSSSGVPPSTASFLDKVHQSRPHEHGDVAFNPGANLAQTRLSEGMRRQEVVRAQVAHIMQDCRTCQSDTRTYWTMWVESCRLARDGTLYIPIEPASKRPAHRVTECQAWAATWLGSEVEERCPSATVHGSLFCTFHKHAIEDHNMAVKERKQ